MARRWEDVRRDRNVLYPTEEPMAHEDVLPGMLRDQLADRSEEVQHLGQFFTFEHLQGLPRRVSRQHAVALSELLRYLPDDGPQLVAGIWRLLESKDCMVRQAIVTSPQDRRETTSSD